MRYSLALDLGSTSLGHALHQLDAQGRRLRLIHIGTRIFPTGKETNGDSLALNRRLKRQARRMRDRKIRRGKAIRRTLVEWNMMPKEKEAQRFLLQDLDTAGQGRDTRPPSDPYNLRARALTEQLPLAHLGRALYHLHQHRGFKSNRKADRKAGDEMGVVAKGIEELQKHMDSAASPTLGHYLAVRKNNQQHVRLRSGIAGEPTRLYPSRAMLEQEFWAIWNNQAKFYPDVMTEERGQHLHRIIFSQRDLKTPEPGRCSYLSSENRIAKSDPLFQRFRMLKELNELTILDPQGGKRLLTIEERDVLLREMMQSAALTFKGMRKLLKLPETSLFNKESERRDKVIGDETATILSSKKKAGPQWHNLSLSAQREITFAIANEDDLGVLQAKLRTHLDLSDAQMIECCEVSLPTGYASIGQTAAVKLCDALVSSVQSEYQAAKAANLTESTSTEAYDLLPPYQEILTTSLAGGSGDPNESYDERMGRITNPTVHIGLNQLRRVVNRIIKIYGKPAEISVEIARDLAMSPKQVAAYNKDLKKKAEHRDRIRNRLIEAGVEPTRDMIDLVRLWSEMPIADGIPATDARLCVYTGTPITFSMLLNSEADVDHILPVSITLDDSANNKVVCLKSANRQKGNRAPSDVAEWQDSYPEIIKRSNSLNTARRSRFMPSALEEYLDENKFLARHLVDTQYLSRVARLYLSCLFAGESEDAERGHPLAKVKAVPGRVTSILRALWGYNSILDEGNTSKDRTDHRHHAIDAAVIGLVTPALIRDLSRLAKTVDAGEVHRVVAKTYRMAQPEDHLKTQLRELLDNMIVSHKSDKGTIDATKGLTSGALHNDTSYGFGRDKDGKPRAVSRKLLSAMKLDDIRLVRDPELRSHLEKIARDAGLFDLDTKGKDKKAAKKKADVVFQGELLRFQSADSQYRGIRRVRIAETLSVIPITDENGKKYKSYKGDSNDYADVWELPDGKWKFSVISTFKAHQSDSSGNNSEIKQNFPTAKKIARLRKNDMVAYDLDGKTIYARVAKMSGGRIDLSEHHRAGTENYKTMSASALKESNFRVVTVNEIGHVFDPRRKKMTATNKI